MDVEERVVANRKPSIKSDITKKLEFCLKERILIIDGAMGTMIQGYKLGEADYRGERFVDWHTDIKG
ncbi:MAG: hypothetical protein ACRCWL_12570, partial [Aeromonas sp.]